MRHSSTVIAVAIVIATLPLFAHAADDDSSTQGWSGSGELGFAAARGNTKSENLNAKLKLGYQDDTWKDDFFLTALRSKGEVKSPIVTGGVVTGSTTSYDTTANRYEAGASSAYKFSPRSYLIGALRYDHDDFASNRWQEVASIGFGYIVLKDTSNELSFEIGPGYKRYQPQEYTVFDTTSTPPTATTVYPATQDEAIARGTINYKRRITDTTSFEDTFLLEAGAKNKYYQNDAGLAVSISKALALKVGYQTRYNSDISPGGKHVDQLFTTNLMYNFGGSK